MSTQKAEKQPGTGLLQVKCTAHHTEIKRLVVSFSPGLLTLSCGNPNHRRHLGVSDSATSVHVSQYQEGLFITMTRNRVSAYYGMRIINGSLDN